MVRTAHPWWRCLGIAGLLCFASIPLESVTPLLADAGGSEIAGVRTPATFGPSGLFPGDTIVIRDTLRADTIRPGDPGLPARPDTILDGVLPGDTLQPYLIDGVVVEVLRSPIQISTAPFSVSVIQDEMLRRGRSNSSIEEALQGLPGVQIQNRFNDAVGERISIRGFGARSQFGVRGIRILVDGIPATLPDGQSTLDHLDLGTLGRVEALRGPSSALYGNAAGGVLDFRSTLPPDVPLKQEFRTVHGDFGLRRNQATTSGRISDVGYQLSLSRYDWAGYRPDPGSTSGSLYGAALRNQLNAQLYLPLAEGELRLTTNLLDLDAENPGSLDINEIAIGSRPAQQRNVTQQAGKEVSQGQVGIAWEGPLRDRTLELSAYGVRRELHNPTPSDLIGLDRTVVGFRSLLRTESVSAMGPLWWGMGFEADLQLDDRQTHENVLGNPGETLLDQKEQVLGGAIFIQALLPIAPILDVLTGLRYDRIRFSADDRLGGVGGRPDGSGGITLDSASPSFGIHAGFHRVFSAFVNLSTAFETPTTSELSTREDGTGGFNLELDPQVGITTELGGRGFLGSVAAWELSYFHTVLYSELVPFEIEGQPDRRYFRNSGRSKRSGWEATLQFTPDEMVNLRFVLSTNDARFREYEVDGVDYAGNRVPGLSPRRFEGILRMGPGRWFTELRGETSAPIPGNDANDPLAESPGYWLIDLRAGANDVRFGALALSPFVGVTNLFDNRYNTSVTANANQGRYFEPGPGHGIYFGASISMDQWPGG